MSFKLYDALEAFERHPIRTALLDASVLTRTLAARTELTDAERERLRVADEVLFSVFEAVTKRFSHAEPGTTTFSVLGQ